MKENGMLHMTHKVAKLLVHILQKVIGKCVCVCGKAASTRNACACVASTLLIDNVTLCVCASRIYDDSEHTTERPQLNKNQLGIYSIYLQTQTHTQGERKSVRFARRIRLISLCLVIAQFENFELIFFRFLHSIK